MSDSFIAALVNSNFNYKGLVADLVPDDLDPAEALSRLQELKTQILEARESVQDGSSEDQISLGRVADYLDGQISSWERTALQLQRTVARFGAFPPTFAATRVPVAEYIEAHGGDKTKGIRRILIANNGMAAAKSIRSFREWALKNLGNERAIEIVVMASEDDRRANMDFIRMADKVVDVPGGSNDKNYANIGLIVHTAIEVNADAVWPGWGHASEDSRLPRALEQSGIIFVGPNDKAMDALGDKISALLVAQTAGVSVYGWSGDHLSVDLATIQSHGIPGDIYQGAVVQGEDAVLAQCQRIGYPCAVKAAGGGGGKGIRKVTCDEEVREAYQLAQREAAGSMFVMKWAPPTARHVEVQVIADAHGNVVTLFERDCSVQRRHQKIIEEAPSSVPPEVSRQMREQAAALAKAVGYVGAGTVEYLFDPETGHYFLELNSRLQVEHPATERVTGVNLPGVQLAIAMGIPLDQIPDIRAFLGADPKGTEPVEMDRQYAARPKGHTIAVRLTAEDADRAFALSSGQIAECTFNDTPNVWGYFSGRTEIHNFADSQFGHLFAWGATREEARLNMLLALKEGLTIRGEIHTNREFLIKLLQEPVFINNDYSTSWLDGLIAQGQKAERPDHDLAVLAGAIYRGHIEFESRLREWVGELTRGHTPDSSRLSGKFSTEFVYDGFKYALNVVKMGEGIYDIELGGKIRRASINRLADGGYRLSLDGDNHVIYSDTERGGDLRLSVDGKSCLFAKENDPTKVKSTMSGRIVSISVEDGAVVKKGDPLMVVEAMKALHKLKAEHDGVVRFRKTAGAIGTGDILADFEVADAGSVKVTPAYDKSWNEPSASLTPVAAGFLDQWIESTRFIENVLGGFVNETQFAGDYARQFEFFRANLLNPDRVVSQLAKVLDDIAHDLPGQLVTDLSAVISNLVQEGPVDILPLDRIRTVIESHLADLTSEADRDHLKKLLEPLQRTMEAFSFGLKGMARQAVRHCIENYLDVEKSFDGKVLDDAIRALQAAKKSDEGWETVFAKAKSHQALKTKNRLILDLLKLSQALDLVGNAAPLLQQLAELKETDYADVSKEATRLYRDSARSDEARKQRVGQLLVQASSRDLSESQAARQELLESQEFINDILVPALWSDNVSTRQVSLDLLVRRSYRVYNTHNVVVDEKGGFPEARWLYSFQDQVRQDKFRRGILAVFGSVGKMEDSLVRLLRSYPKHDGTDSIDNTLTIAINMGGVSTDEAALVERLSGNLGGENKALLDMAGIGRITFIMNNDESYPRYYTFRKEDNGYVEDPAYRHIHPPLAYLTEHRRMANFKIRRVPGGSHKVHVYVGQGLKGLAEKAQAKAGTKVSLDERLFVRGVSRTATLQYNPETQRNDIPEVGALFRDALNDLELASVQPGVPRTDWNQIFLNVYPSFAYDPAIHKDLESYMRLLGGIHQDRLARLRVKEVEVKINFTGHTFRYFLSNPTGHALVIEGHQEVSGLGSVGKEVWKPLNGNPVKASGPYQEFGAVDRRRITAQSKNTTYAYDWPDLFEEALRGAWDNHADIYGVMPNDIILDRKELVLNAAGGLEESDRPAGQNTIGMVALRLTLATPAYPHGRDVIVISNDVNIDNGSFATAEDNLFQKASELARQEGIPRLYMAANAGARIGLADEIFSNFKVAWTGEAEETKRTASFFYLEDADYQKFKKSVVAEPTEIAGKTCWKITAVVGLRDLNQENLAGSGLIAGETSQAYDETFTLTFVTGKNNVGIGAYVTRLGSRVIQKDGSPILLTGKDALNKILGGTYYVSNNEIGDTDIMLPNGVSHLGVKTDLEGVSEIIRWLDFVSAKKGGSLPILAGNDLVKRDVGFVPTAEPYDPRQLLAGKEIKGTEGQADQWLSGLLDRDSFKETLADWGKSVVVGRGRLGGIPLGVIVPESRAMERVVPADPGDRKSQKVVEIQAGCVWTPDSAFKTAQHIKDINREGLPLLIMPNWRGFSGGTRDMFREVLKFGSFIVDALREFKQPVMVMMPPYSDLRGGAWVVVDPNINDKGMMEMYADSRARGGVLEPAGLAEIKLREPQMLILMNRLDDRLAELNAQLKTELPADQRALLQRDITARQKLLMPLYTQVALQFVDLHDRPERMLAKGVINGIVPWETSRRFFADRLKTRLDELEVAKRVDAAYPGMPADQRTEILAQLLALTDDGHITVEAQREALYAALISSYRADQVKALMTADPPAAVLGMLEGLRAMNPAHAHVTAEYLRAGLADLFPGEPAAPAEKGTRNKAPAAAKSRGRASAVPAPVTVPAVAAPVVPYGDPKAPKAHLAGSARGVSGLRMGDRSASAGRASSVATKVAVAPQVTIKPLVLARKIQANPLGVQPGLIRGAGVFASRSVTPFVKPGVGSWIK